MRLFTSVSLVSTFALLLVALPAMGEEPPAPPSVSEGEDYVNQTPGHTVCANTTPPTLKEPTPNGCDEPYTCCYSPTGVGKEPEGQYQCGYSVIENVTFRYVSDVLDYAADANPLGGCAPCGSDPTAISGLPSVPYHLPSLQIRHILRPGNTNRSSMGPGVFSNFDITLNMFHELP